MSRSTTIPIAYLLDLVETNRVPRLTDDVFPAPLTNSVLWDRLVSIRGTKLPYQPSLGLLQALEKLYTDLQAPPRTSSRVETPQLKQARTGPRFNRTPPSEDDSN